jgi:hypothetical protein
VSLRNTKIAGSPAFEFVNQKLIATQLIEGINTLRNFKNFGDPKFAFNANLY